MGLFPPAVCRTWWALSLICDSLSVTLEVVFRSVFYGYHYKFLFLFPKHLDLLFVPHPCLTFFLSLFLSREIVSGVSYVADSTLALLLLTPRYKHAFPFCCCLFVSEPLPALPLSLLLVSGHSLLMGPLYGVLGTKASCSPVRTPLSYTCLGPAVVSPLPILAPPPCPLSVIHCNNTAPRVPSAPSLGLRSWTRHFTSTLSPPVSSHFGVPGFWDLKYLPCSEILAGRVLLLEEKAEQIVIRLSQ